MLRPQATTWFLVLLTVGALVATANAITLRVDWGSRVRELIRKIQARNPQR